MRWRDETGLTLLELLVVVALIGIIAAFALPRLLRARMAANEASAIASLRSIGIAEDLYARVCGGGGYSVSLVALGTPPPGTSDGFLPADLTGSETPGKSGYAFALADGAGAAAGPNDCHGNATRTRFYVSAVPQAAGIGGRRSFATTTGQVIWEVAGGAAPGEPFGPPAAPVQ